MRHGALERRDGTVIVSTHSGYRGRMFEFPITQTISYAACLTSDGKLYVDDRQGNLYGDNFGANPDFKNGTTGWTDASTGNASLDWVAGRILMQTGDTVGVAKLQQTAVSSNAAAEHVIHVEAKSLFGSSSLDIKLGTSLGGSDLLSATMEIGEEDLYYELSNVILGRVTSTGDTRVTSTGDTRITDVATYYLSVELSDATEESGWWVDSISFHEREGTYTEVALDHPYDVNDLEELQAEMVPGEEECYFYTGKKPPYVLAYNDGAWTFTKIHFSGKPITWKGDIDWDTSSGSQAPFIGDVVEILPYLSGGIVGNVYRFSGTETDLTAVNYATATGWTDLGAETLLTDNSLFTTDDGKQFLSVDDTVEILAGYAIGGTVGNVYKWAGTVDLSSENYTGSNWTDQGLKATYVAAANFPGTGGFFGGRSWWGALPTTQDTINGSKSANYQDLRLGISADSDGIEITLDDHGEIQWIRGEQDLLVGTKNGEYVITSEAGPLTPSDITANKQSANGSAKMQGRPIGNSVAYTSLDGAKIRDMEYKFVVNGWQSLDISFTAEHMFQEYGRVKEIHYAKDPESLIWFITDEGNLIGCTFDPANNVIGWHRHPTNGKVISGCVMTHNGTASLWLLIDRRCGSATKTLFVERTSPLSMMDSKVGLHYAVDRTAIEGFKHLANHLVWVTVDGVQADDVTLDANGDGTASISGKLIEVGLQYNSKMVTLPTDIPVKGGTGMSHIKRFNKIYSRLYDSYPPVINSNQTTVAASPFSGDVNVTHLGWTTDAENIMEMNAPFKCKISGIFGEAEENKR